MQWPVTDWSSVVLNELIGSGSCIVSHVHVGLVACAHRIGPLICVPKYIYMIQCNTLYMYIKSLSGEANIAV